jgi:hypothetical protein
MVWTLRERFRKTYEHTQHLAGVQGFQAHPLDELISIPNNSDLIAQLSQPLYKTSSNGKILIESKADMAKRGVKSPDYFDSLAYAFAPPPEARAEETLARILGE